MSTERPSGPDEPPSGIWPERLGDTDVEEAYVVDREGQPKATFREIAASYFRGPLPSPEALRQYNEAIPGLGERIVTNWEQESFHRRSLERRLVEGGIRNQSRGQLIAAAIAIIVAIGGIVLIATGHSTAGLIALLPNLVALVGLFIYRSATGGD